jgi:hypothetical protein
MSLADNLHVKPFFSDESVEGGLTHVERQVVEAL